MTESRTELTSSEKLQRLANRAIVKGRKFAGNIAAQHDREMQQKSSRFRQIHAESAK